MSVKRLVITWSFVLLLGGWLPSSSPAADDASVVSSLGSIGMTVSDMDRSVAFYQDVLNFTKISEVEVRDPDGHVLQVVAP